MRVTAGAVISDFLGIDPPVGRYDLAEPVRLQFASAFGRTPGGGDDMKGSSDAGSSPNHYFIWPK